MAELAVDLTYGTALIEAARERELDPIPSQSKAHVSSNTASRITHSPNPKIHPQTSQS